MDDHRYDFDSHLEDDLSYMYDLDGDYSTRRGSVVYTRAREGLDEKEEQEEETKALLLKIINDNKKEYEEKLKKQETRYEERIQQLEDSIARRSYTRGSTSYTNCDERDLKLQRLEEALSQVNILQKSHHTSLTKPMESFDDDYRRDEERNSQNEDTNETDINVKFAEDIFSVMMICPFCSKGYFLGIATFMFQVLLTFDYVLSFIRFARNGFIDDRGNHDFEMPNSINWNVGLARICVAILSILLLSDIQIAIQYLFLFRNGNVENMEILRRNQVKETSEGNLSVLRSVYVPNLLRFHQGVIVIFMLFILIIENEDFIELLMNFTALFIISQIDDIIFKVVRRGYFFGYDMTTVAAKIEKIEFTEKREQKVCSSFAFRSFLLGMIHITMLSLTGTITWQQVTGQFFFTKYPYCQISKDEINLFGDGICDGGTLNSLECDFDGGDCDDFNIAYPNCAARDPSKLGDGICDEVYNNQECNYDENDCNSCPFGDPDRLDELEDGNRLKNLDQCDGGLYSTKRCNYDAGACDSLRVQFPRCDFEEIGNMFDENDYAPVLGDGICDSLTSDYNTEECGFEFGDCVD